MSRFQSIRVDLNQAAMACTREVVEGNNNNEKTGCCRLQPVVVTLW